MQRHESVRMFTLFVVLIVGASSTSAPQPARAMQGAGGGESNPFAGASTDASASFFSGVASVSVPILIPPGRKLTTPKLALGYSSQGGMSPAGFGWSFTIGVLSRSTRHGVPRCDGPHADEYRVTLSGSSNELVERTADLYLFEIDEAYTEAIPDRGANTWTLSTREGLVYTFGEDPTGNARVFAGADEFWNPAECALTTEWHLTRIEDPNGNHIEISYEKSGDTPIPVEIAYGGNAPAGIEHPYRVRLETEDVASLEKPIVRSVTSGVDQRLARRIRAIVVEARSAVGGVYDEVRRYTLDFDDSMRTQEFLLDSVAASDLPTRRFEYSTSTPTVVTSRSEPLDNPNPLGITRGGGPMMQLMDLNGDGLLDRLCVNSGAWHAAYGDPSEVQFTGYEPCTSRGGNWNVPSDTGTSLNLISRQHDGVDVFITIDIDGDGIPDLVRRNSSANDIRVYKGSCTSAYVCGFSDQYASWNNPGPSSNEALRKIETGNRGQQIKRDLIDMNGDGLVDLVRADASTGDWEVYLNTGAGFEPEALVYADVNPLIAYSSFPDHNADEERQLLDVNGDGLVDWVSAPVHEHPLNRSKRIPNKYFAVDPYGEAWGPYDLDDGPYLCPTTSDYYQAVLCANPTGLPSGWAIVGAASVRLNTGWGFSEPIYSPAPIWAAGSESANRLRGTWTAYSSRDTHTYRDFVDVNGDGRVDWVHSGYAYDGSSNWFVLYNLGDGRFGGPLEILQPARVLQGSAREVFLGEVRPLEFLSGMGLYMGRSFSHTSPGDRSDLLVTVLDVDADGLAEKVRSSEIGSEDQWVLKTLRFEDSESPHTRPMLLTTVHDGLGGETQFRYAPSSNFVGSPEDIPGLPFVMWVVTGIRRTDGLCDSQPIDWFDIGSSPVGNPCLAAGHEVVQKIEYADGFFDGDAREFRGFGTVWVQDGPDELGSVRRIDFYQDEFLSGKVASEEVYVGGMDLLSRSSFEWRAVPDGPRTQIYVLEQRVERFALYQQFGTSGDLCTVHRNSISLPNGSIDQKTRIHASCSMACAGAGEAETDQCDLEPVGKKQVETTYAAPVDGAAVRVWDRPSHLVTRHVDDAGAVQLSSETRFQYDALGGDRVDRGNVTLDQKRVSSSLDLWVEKHLEYDDGAASGPGNVTRIELPGGIPREPTTIEFDPVFQLWVTAEVAASTTGRSGARVKQRIEQEYDIRNGRVKRTVGVHGAASGDVSGAIHDSLGRLLCEYEPGTSCVDFGSSASREYVYTDADPDAPDPVGRMSSLEVRRREPNAASGFVVTTSYWDALGRERLTTNEQVVGIAGVAAPGNLETVVVRHLHYEANGKLARSFEPYLAAQPLSLSPPSAVAAEQYGYELNGNPSGFFDPAGRVFETVQFDGSTPRTYYFGDSVRSVDALESPSSVGNHVVETLDQHGRTIERLLYAGAGSDLQMQQNFRYDGSDRVVEEWFGGDPTTSISRTYDLLGRLVETRDPDSGLWTTLYDGAGNVVFVDDPQPDQSVQSCYDELDRTVLKCARSSDVFDPDLCTAAERVCDREYAYFYDEPDNVAGLTNLGTGLLTTVEGPGNKHRYVYDLRRRVTTQIDEIKGISGTTSFEYASEIERLERMIYPDGEIVEYGYDAVGAPRTLGSLDSSGALVPRYVTEISYDLRGRPLYLRRGNFTRDWFAYHGPEEGFGLASLRSERVGLNPAVSPRAFIELEYPDYDGRSRIVEVVDRERPTGPLSMSAGYEYDAAGRLIFVSGPISENFSYDAIGNMVASNGRSFEFDVEGAGRSAPHRLVGVSDPANGSWTMTYDANGQRISKSHSGGTESHTYGFDAFGSLRTLAVDGITKTFGYDHNGQRVYETREGNTRRFFGGYSESKDDRLFKYYSIGAQLIATRSSLAPQLSGPSISLARSISLPPEAYWVVMSSAVLMLLIPVGKSRRSVGVQLAASGGMGAAMLVTAGILPMALTSTGCVEGLLVRHYHMSHRGSPTAISTPGGMVERLYRYSAYGEVRRYDGYGAPLEIDAASRREFTGYHTDEESGLQYSGARFYDPSLARFLSPDPIEVTADPYAYVGWDPVNRVDPNGTNPWVIGALITLAFLAVVAGAVVNAVKTGSAGVFFRDFAVGWASMNVGLLIGILAPPSASVLIGSVGVGRSLYALGRAESVDTLVLAGVGLGLAAVGSAYGVYQSSQAATGGSGKVVGSGAEGFLETHSVSPGVEVAGMSEENMAALPGRALIKLSNDRVNSQIAQELAALRVRVAAGEFEALDVAAWEVRTWSFNRDLGVSRIISGSLQVAAKPTGTPGFPYDFAPLASIAPLGTTTTISPPIRISGGTALFGRGGIFWRPPNPRSIGSPGNGSRAEDLR
ncbi:MAG: hypothetical protein CL908_02030 [Deltaproteobacteria bacterium]|nr:hypothetical protein [Deltaproteobacteria bacterium]